MRLNIRLLITASILLIFSASSTAKPPPWAGGGGGGKNTDFTYSLDCGSVNSTTPAPELATLLIGGAEAGATGELEATQWLLEHADGGDYLVIRTGGTGSQAAWVCDNFGDLISSGAELSIDTVAGADDTTVEGHIRDAEVIFIAGGDQNAYEDTWKGTAVEDALNDHINAKQAPISGTSAGMAILGQSYYAPADLGVLSSEILDDPFHPYTTDINHGDFLLHPQLDSLITDTHLDREHGSGNENRYGRVFGFLARSVDDNGNQLPSYAIAAEEGAFVAIDKNGIAHAFGNGSSGGAAVYFLQTNGAGPETITSGTPLVWDHDGTAVLVYRIEGSASGSGQFDLNDWTTASGGDWLYWYTTGGYAGFNFAGGSCTSCSAP